MKPLVRFQACSDAPMGERALERVQDERDTTGVWHRRRLIGVLLGMALGDLLASSDASANEPRAGFRLIVHPNNPAAVLSREQVTDIFLKKSTRWDDGEAVHPFDQRVDSAVRGQFSDAVLRRSVAAVRHYWQQRIFSGRGVPPPELESDDAVMRRVQGDRGAIGYVSERASLSGVKLVAIR